MARLGAVIVEAIVHHYGRDEFLQRQRFARQLAERMRTTMAELEAGLDAARFARIHRGTLVRLDQVREVVPATHGDYDVVLRDGTVLKMSRRYRGRVLG